MNKKYMKLAVYLAIVGVVLVLGGSLAYFYQDITVPNTFKTMTYNVELEEEFNNNWGVKKVYIRNKDETNASVVLRVNYNEIWSKEINGNLYTLSNTINGENVVTKNFTNAFLNDFVLGNDGWYYYKKILVANSSVQLLDSIALKDNLITNEYNSYNYELHFNYEAIQATSQAVNDIWGKNITINGGNVTWNF